LRPPIYVITMKRRQDRRDRLLPHLGKEQVFLSYDVCGDLDGTLMTVDDFPDIQLFDWQLNQDTPTKLKEICFPAQWEYLQSWWNRPMRVGEICCSLAHAGCWDDAIARNCDAALFLEDDALITAENGVDEVMGKFVEISKVDPEWDLLYFGRWPLAPDGPQVGNFVVPGLSYDTHAYALSRKGLRKIVQLEIRKKVMPADEFLPATYTRHPRDDVAAAVPPTLRAYAVSPDLIVQWDAEGDVSETENSQFLQTQE